MLQLTKELKRGVMPNGTMYASNRRLVNEWRERNLEKRKEQERAAWHRRKAKVKAQKAAALEKAVQNTLEFIQN